MYNNHTYICPVCGEEKFYDDTLFNIFGVMVCEDCFIEEYKDFYNSRIDFESIEDIAEELGVEIETVDSYMENSYINYQESKWEADTGR